MNSLASFRILVVTAVAALALTACSQRDRSDAKAAVKEGYADAQTFVENAWNDAKSFAFDKRDEFAAHAKALSSRMEVQVAEVRANYADAQASASRKAAMAELKSAEADYQQKLAALGDATAATWESAKQNVILAWKRLVAAYNKARAD